MRETILSRLADASAAHNVTILYACESGSRGWGFASDDSDFDVRFLYLHPLDWYLSIHARRDVIEYPISEGLDIVGWDFRKTLQLFQRSNPRLFDWISSPIIYAPAHPIVERLWKLAPEYFSPFVYGRHYGQSMRHYMARAINGDRMHVKNFFYAVRSVILLRWVEQEQAPSPMDFWTCAERVIDSTEILSALRELFLAKQQSSEQALIPTIPLLEQYCRQEIYRLQSIIPFFRDHTGPEQPLDRLFQAALRYQ